MALYIRNPDRTGFLGLDEGSSASGGYRYQSVKNDRTRLTEGLLSGPVEHRMLHAPQVWHCYFNPRCQLLWVKRLYHTVWNSVKFTR